MVIILMIGQSRSHGLHCHCHSDLFLYQRMFMSGQGAFIYLIIAVKHAGFVCVL